MLLHLVFTWSGEMVATLMDSPEDKAETEEEDISGLLELEACAAKRF